MPLGEYSGGPCWERQLCDFGLARMLEDEPSGLTTTGLPRLTLYYASPELLNNVAGHTLKSDVWAWGCLFLSVSSGYLYVRYSNVPDSAQIMAGSRPYPSHTEISVVLAIAQGRSPANLGELTGSEFFLIVRDRCWRISSEVRPSMLWCTEVLSRRTTALFRAYCEKDCENIPLECKTEAGNFHVIRNPESHIRYTCEDLPRLFETYVLFPFELHSCNDGATSQRCLLYIGWPATCCQNTFPLRWLVQL